MLRTVVSLVALLLLGGLVSAQSSETPPVGALALIGIEQRENGIEIVGSALSLSEAELTGEMEISRRGSSGSVTTRQGGTLSLSAGETGDVARVGISFQPGDHLTVTMTLKQNGNIISEASISTSEVATSEAE